MYMNISYMNKTLNKNREWRSWCVRLFSWWTT